MGQLAGNGSNAILNRRTGACSWEYCYDFSKNYCTHFLKKKINIFFYNSPLGKNMLDEKDVEFDFRIFNVIIFIITGTFINTSNPPKLYEITIFHTG